MLNIKARFHECMKIRLDFIMKQEGNILKKFYFLKKEKDHVYSGCQWALLNTD